MRKIFKKDTNEEHNFWMSYTDLMSGFLVVFIILTVLLFNYITFKLVEVEISIMKWEIALSDL